jgi:hypothetical protein
VFRASLAAFFVFVGLAGCAAVAGLESIQESPCPFGCDGSTGDDGSTDSTVNSADSSSADTASSADTSAADGAVDVVDMDNTAHFPDSGRTDATEDAPSSDPDSGASDSSAKGDAHDGAVGSDAEAGAHDAGHDGAVDSGCGPLDTVTSCGACGVACPAAGHTAGVGMAMCTGTTCQYTCNTGYLDCNASVAPDTDGCECAWSGAITATCCAGNACPTPHVTGYATQPSGASQTFYDCETTVDEQLAIDACTAYSGDAIYCASGTCGGSTTPTAVCNRYAPLSQDSVCWSYSGTSAGWALDVGTQLWTCPSGGAAGEVQYH